MTQDLEKLRERAALATRETRQIEFKSEFDIDSAGAWVEVIKDIIALANTGGGFIIFGVADDGASKASFDRRALSRYDTANVVNKIAKYTGYPFDDLAIVEIVRKGVTHTAFEVGASNVPIIFTKPGTYDTGDGKTQKTAFGVGTVYFRHGAKSEPGVHQDFVRWRDRAIDRVKQSWLGGIKKVVSAPEGHSVVVDTAVRVPTDTIVRFSNDPTAPKALPRNVEEVWPFRQKELLRLVNGSLPVGAKINGHDIQCVNWRIDVLHAHPEFAYKPHRLASVQYSEAYAHWLVDSYQRDPLFFENARKEHRQAVSKK